MTERIEKGMEVRNGLFRAGINENTAPNLTKFLEKLTKWEQTGEHSSGIINLPEFKRDIVFQLEKPAFTVVKLSVEKEATFENTFKGTRKIGRNDICPECDSGKKYKKCCGSI